MSRSTNYRNDKAEAARLFAAFGVNTTNQQSISQPTTSSGKVIIQPEDNESNTNDLNVPSENEEQEEADVNIQLEDNETSRREDLDVQEQEVADDQELAAVEGDESEEYVDSEDETPSLDGEDIIVDIGVKLCQWSTQNHISDDAMNDLLGYLKKYHFPSLPKTNKTLKAASKLNDVPITRMGDGEHCYIGIKRALEQILQRNNIEEQPEIDYRLQFGIDGLPLTKSSRSCFWPILVKITSFQEVFPVVMFYGTGKPSCVHEYMNEFVTELDHILKMGMEFNNFRLKFLVDAFIMDAPAKAFVLDIKVCNYNKNFILHTHTYI